jgi:hypothetical protein
MGVESSDCFIVESAVARETRFDDLPVRRYNDKTSCWTVES